MNGLPEPLSELIEAFRRLPGIGEKSAQRIAFHLLRAERSAADTLARAASTLHDRVRHCGVCGNFTERDPCRLCNDPGRADAVLCVVEDPADIGAIERAGTFSGRYFVLMGSLSPIGASQADDYRVSRLVERVRSGAFREIVLAMNPTNDGESTAARLAVLLRSEGVRVTRIGIGVPMGSELVHADQTTMAEALTHRSEM